MIYKKGLPREGFGMYDIFLLGRVVSSVEIGLLDFFENRLGKKLILNDLRIKLGLTEGETEQNRKKIDTEISTIEAELQVFNGAIEDLNKNVLAAMGISKEIVKLDIKNICGLIRDKLTPSYNLGVAFNLMDKNFHLQLSQEIGKVIASIENLKIFIKEGENFKGVDELNELGLKNVSEAININSIGYGKTAVLCVGRAIEGLINSYITKLFEKDKISSQEYEKKSKSEYNEKIGFLKGRFLTEEEFSDLNSFSFKRNKGGHPDLGEIDINRSKTLIQQGIWLMIDLQRKIELTKSDAEIADERARKILGGKSEWGGPILYGTPEEKLKQLEGYGGELIEEIKKKLKREIEDSNLRSATKS